MGLIKAFFGATGGTLADQWREYFYCDSLEEDILATKGKKRTSGRSSNTKGEDNIISNGSLIAVNDGQCMIIVEQGKVVDFCAEPGEFTYDTSTEPSLFYGKLGDGIVNTFKTIGKRFTFGGDTGKDQRIYYFNTKEIVGNKYGTANAVPFRVVDQNVGLDIDIAIKCFGEYSYRVSDPMLFYTNVCGNVSEDFLRSTIDSQLKTELMTALQPAFAKISEMGIRYSALPGHTDDLAKALNDVLSEKWEKLRGLRVVSFGVSSVKASEEDEAMIKELQRNAAFRNPTMAAANLAGAQAQAMQDAAKNQSSGGAFMAFAGMNMAANAGGVNANTLYGMGQQPEPAAEGWDCPACGHKGNLGKFCLECGAKKPEPKPAGESWDCPACGHKGNPGKFCLECGAKKPEAKPEGWICPQCGAVNKGKFCLECGTKKPAGEPLYKCDKCGWEPEDPAHPPKFCPQCGDPFNDGDVR